MRERVTLFRVFVVLVLAVVVTWVILLRIPAGKFLLMPDVAHPVAPLVHVPGAKPPKGGGKLFFVDVQERRASEFDVLFPWVNPHSKLVPAEDIVPPGATDKQVVHAELHQMATSKQIAAAVAERQLGYEVNTVPTGTLVDYVYPHTNAHGKLQMGDVIESVNGTPTLTLDQLHTLLSRLRPGAVVTLGIRRGSKQQTVRVQTVAKTVSGKRVAVVGIVVEQSTRIVLPKKVAIDSGDIGGPSAGLAFALEVMRQFGRDVTHGYRVAATGEIRLDGSVSPIGGVEQKTWGVREAGAQVFLVPAGANAKVAKKFAGPNLRIIPVSSLAQALRALAALPKLP